MTPLTFTLITFFASIVAGLLGSLLGLGGGIVVVPVLTLLLRVDIHFAVGASIVSVIATSSGAAASYVKQHLTNMRVGMLLETATAAGALSGAFLASYISGRALFILFGIVLAYTAVQMFRGNDHRKSTSDSPAPRDPLADRLALHGHYFDELEQREIHYQVGKTRLGLILSYFAGINSALLGVGGGVIKVPAMNVAMGMPIKVATATSNFMIGVTAAASAGVYFVRGEIDPFIAGPVAAGVLLGAITGSKLLGRTKNSVIRRTFVIVMLWVSVQMLLKGIR